MKKQNINKIGLKKLTIARINVTSLQAIKGGTSMVTNTTVYEIEGICYNVK